jgi:hypothetical protein
MRNRTGLAGLCMLCALIVGALAAQGAAAAGTTSFTCKAVETGASFSDAHCVTAKFSGFGFNHVEVAAGTTTEAQLTNEKTATLTTASTPIKLVTKKAGLVVEISCTTATGTGTTKNVAGPPMKLEGQMTFTFSGCTILKPANCTLSGGSINFSSLSYESFHNGGGELNEGQNFPACLGSASNSSAHRARCRALSSSKAA